MIYSNLRGGGSDAFTIPVVVLSKQIKQHIIDIIRNHGDSMTHYVDIVGNIISSPFPCNVSKKITNGLCGYKDGFGLVDFKQIKSLVNKAKRQVTSISKSSNIPSNTRKLQDNIKKIEEINRKQTDGIICNISKFITHGLCKVNEITINMFNKNMQSGLIGLNIIPGKLDNIMAKSQLSIQRPLNLQR